ncbi:MAG: hypothetical protein ACR2PT_19505 [Endozoicomonas sp.]
MTMPLRAFSCSLILFTFLLGLSARADTGLELASHELSSDSDEAATALGFGSKLLAFWFYDGGDVCRRLGVRQPDQPLSEKEFINTTMTALPFFVGSVLAELVDGEVLMQIFDGEASLRELIQGIMNSLKEFGNAVFTLSEPYRDTTIPLILPTGLVPIRLQDYPVQLHFPEPVLTLDSLLQEKVLQFYLFNAFSSLVQIGYQLKYGGLGRKIRNLVLPGFMLLAVIRVSRGGSSYKTRCLVKTTAIFFGTAATASAFESDTTVTTLIYEMMQGAASVAIISASSPTAIATAAVTKIALGTHYRDCQGTVNSLMPLIYLFLPLSVQHHAGRNIPLLDIQPTTAMKVTYLVTDATQKARNHDWTYLIPMIFLANVMNRMPGSNTVGTCLLLAVTIGNDL